MPATSQAQQKFFGMAYAVRQGELSRDKVSKEILDIVDGDMSDEKLKEYASTKHDDIPKKKAKESMTSLKDFIGESMNEGRMQVEQTYTELIDHIWSLSNSIKEKDLKKDIQNSLMFMRVKLEDDKLK